MTAHRRRRRGLVAFLAFSTGLLAFVMSWPLALPAQGAPKPRQTPFFPFPTPTQRTIFVTPVPYYVPTPDEGQPQQAPSPLPTPSPKIKSPIPSVETSPTVIPIGGVAALPSPDLASSGGGIGDDSPAGMPVPFILVGSLLVAGAVGSLLYSFRPASDRLPRGGGRGKRSGGAPVVFTPYGAATEPGGPAPGGAVPLRPRRHQPRKPR